MEKPSQGKLGHMGNASMACVGDRVRVGEQRRDYRKPVTGKRAGDVQECGMWRQELGLAAGGERFRERMSSRHKDVDMQRQ